MKKQRGRVCRANEEQGRGAVKESRSDGEQWVGDEETVAKRTERR